MKGIEFIKEYKISLVNLTPLKIGNGKDELDLLLDKNTQEPIIQGSSIAGAVKNYLADLDLEEKVDEVLGSQKKVNEKDDDQKEKIKKIESKIYISDSYGNKFELSSRTGIKRSYQFGTSEDKKKYDIDFVDMGTEFILSFKLFAKQKSELETEDELIKNIIEGFKSGNLRLGANKMSGFGQFEVKKVEAREYSLSKKEDLISYILDNKKYNTLKLESFEDVGNKGYIEFDFKGSIIDSMIVKQYLEVDDVDCINMRNSKDESIIPGTTIKGLFREYNTKILKTLGQEDDLFIIEDIYGSDSNKCKDSDDDTEKNHKIGKLLTSDVVVKNPKYCTYNRIKVDRFTGGVVTGGKFDEKRVQGDLEFRISLKKLEHNNQAAIGLILLTFRDLGLAKLAIGSSSSIGAGRINGGKITVKDDDKAVEINFNDGKLTSNDMNYVNDAIKAIKDIKKVVPEKKEASDNE